MILGIDFDTWKLTLCAASDEVVLFEQAKIRDRGHDTLDAIQGIPASLSLAAGRLQAMPEEIHIERGRGQNRKGEYEMGAIYGATITAVRRIWPDAHVESVTTQEWKKAVTAAVGVKTAKGVPGNGNAPKELANSACRQLLFQRGLDPARLTADQLDAFGIVYAVTA